MLKPLLIPPTYCDPLIDFNPDGQLWLKGRSIPIDAVYAYRDISEWLNEFSENPPEKVIFNIWLSHHNDGASKYLIQLIKKLIDCKINLEIKWYYEEEDEDTIHLGESMSSLLQMNFEFIEVSEED